MTKEARQFAAILKGWGPSFQRAVAKANSNRWPSGAPGGKGGQYAPGGKGGGGAPYSTSGMGFKPKQLSLFNLKAPQLDAGKPSQSDYGVFGNPMGSWGEPAAPKAPPPGAKPHPHVNDKGQPVTINYPTKTSAPETWKNPDATATFTPGSATPAVLNGVPMKPWADAPQQLHEWVNVPGQKPEIDANYPLEAKPGMSVGAGVIIEEPDGRIWLTKPTNHFGGYMQTFPKGTVEHGLSLQASAIKEAYEETGLKIEITGVLGDFERTTSVARFYTAKRVGGTPADMGWESQAIRLAAPRDMGKLLNSNIDKGILDAYREEHFIKRAPLSLLRHHAQIEEASARRGLDWLYKTARKSDMLHGKAGHWQHQERWPGGTPLGGQWKAMGADGLTLPPLIAGGLAGSNAAYQKKANALHAMAQAGDHKALLDNAITLEKKVKADADAGKKSTHVKWNAQVSQYANQLVKDVLVKPQAEAIADNINGPEKLSSLSYAGPKPGGSNDGAVYADLDGTKWLVKGNNYASAGGLAMSDDRAKNEVLASKLMAAAGIPGPEIKLVDLEGKHSGSLGVAVKWIDGLQKFNPNDAGQLAAVQNQFAVHAWLGNWDVLGQSLDNTMFKDGKAINIDPGGSILFRAQGAPKKEGAFDKEASDWESMRSTDQHQKSVYGKMTASQLQESAKRLANVSDDTINKLVDVYGPGNLKSKVALATTLRARRDAILEKAGLKTIFIPDVNLKDAEPAPAPVPPKITDAVPAPAGTAIPSSIAKPAFNSGYDKTDNHYSGLANKAEAFHAAGDIAGLKGMVDMQKNPGTWGGKTFSSGKLQAYHSALVADLEAKQGAAVAQVAAGKAIVTDDKGQEWKATDGVLNPVAPTAKPLPNKVLAPLVQAHLDGKVASLTSSAYSSIIDAAQKGDLEGVKAVSAISYPGLVQFKHSVIMAMTGAAPAAVPASLMKPEPAPRPGIKLTKEQATTLADEHHPGPMSNLMFAAVSNAMEGNTNKVKAFPADTPEEKSLKSALLNAMAGKTAPALDPAAAVPAPKPALPNFDAEKLSADKSNAASHNPKVDLIAKLAKAGDVKGLLALNYGTNTYGKKQAKLANDALAALGSPHKVIAGQKTNSHPALVGGTAQTPAAPAAPAVKPQAYTTAVNNPSADHSWVKLSPGQRVVEAGEQFGVKWVKVQNPAKGFSPSDIPQPPDFYKNGSQGATGTWKSTKAEVNDANNLAVKQIYDAAVASKGDLSKLDALKFDIVGVGQVSISGHKAAAVKEYFDQVKSELEAQTKVTFETKQSGSFTAGYSDVAGKLAELHSKKNYSEFKSHAAKAADYLVLSKDAASNIPVPTLGQFKETSTNNPELKPFLQASKVAYQKLPEDQRSAFKAYTGSSYDAWNEALRKGTIDAYAGAKSMLKGFADAAQDIPEGTIIWRGIGVGKSVYESAAGSIIQDGSFQSSSYGAHPGGPGYGKGTWLRIHVPKGVKAIDATNFSHYGDGEREIIIQNNVRYAVLKVEQHDNFTDSNGKKHGKKTIVDLMALPH